MTFPTLTPGQVVVVQAEVDAGIVLTTDGRRHTGSGEVFRTFSSLDSAREFARQVVSARPKVECNIYDSEQTRVERITSQS